MPAPVLLDATPLAQGHATRGIGVATAELVRALATTLPPDERPALLTTPRQPPLAALAAGTLTLAADNPALRDVGGDAPADVLAGDPDALADAIEHLAQHASDRAIFAERGRARAAGSTRERTARSTAAVWGEAMHCG